MLYQWLFSDTTPLRGGGSNQQPPDSEALSNREDKWLQVGGYSVPSNISSIYLHEGDGDVADALRVSIGGVV